MSIAPDTWISCLAYHGSLVLFPSLCHPLTAFVPMAGRILLPGPPFWGKDDAHIEGQTLVQLILRRDCQHTVHVIPFVAKALGN